MPEQIPAFFEPLESNAAEDAFSAALRALPAAIVSARGTTPIPPARGTASIPPARRAAPVATFSARSRRRTAATNTAAAAAAAAIAAVFARARLVDTQPTAPNLLVVQPGNGRFRLAVRGHLYKAEPFGLAALTIANDRRIAHSTIDLEGSAQFILGGTVRQISYVNVHKILFQRSGLKDKLASSTVGEAG
jgi:hypothetical protein